MAEKEERIYIGKINWQEPLGFCPVPLGECNSFCEDCQGGMTRQEAIERMAKALFESIVETQAQCSCLNMAETALNALLEAQNER